MADIRLIFSEAGLPMVGREAGNPRIKSEDAAPDPKRVAVVHGRDHDARDGMFDFLRALASIRSHGTMPSTRSAKARLITERFSASSLVLPKRLSCY
jgi:hypothetical protein